MIPLLFTMLSVALFYLGSRALITRFLWKRYPRPVAQLFDCAACVGFWWGGILSIVFSGAHLTYLGLELDRPFTWPLVGLCSLVATPIGAWLMQYSLDYLGTLAVSPEQPEQPKPKWTELP